MGLGLGLGLGFALGLGLGFGLGVALGLGLGLVGEGHMSACERRLSLFSFSDRPGASLSCLRRREAAVRYSRTRLHASVFPAPLSPEMSTDWSTKAPSAAASFLASSARASVVSKACSARLEIA